MVLSTNHRESILVLYRTLLRHLVRLPDQYKLSSLEVVRREFKSHKKVQGGENLRNVIWKAYNIEKIMFQYRNGEIDISRLTPVLQEYQKLYESRVTTTRIKRKPSIIESYPVPDEAKLAVLKNEQRVERLINKLVMTDQARSRIPHKSALDSKYVRQLYGRKVIHMKASQAFSKMWTLFGPNSAPYESKYIYNFSDRITLMSLKLPMGTFKEVEKSIYRHCLKHLQYLEDLEAVSKYKQNYSRWMKMEDEWEAGLKLRKGSPAKFQDVVNMAEGEITRLNNERLENEAKVHNRKVMYLKYKTRPYLERYHQTQKQNFAALTTYIANNNVHEYNEYSNSLASIIRAFGFEKSQPSFNTDEFEETLDPAEYNWCVDPNEITENINNR